MNYKEFLLQKQHSLSDSGFDPLFYPEIAFDFQRHIIEKAVKKGRMAVFADTGLGKTLIQLSIAHNVVLHTNRKVLILTPLAVAFQFIKEAEKIGVPDIEYSKDGKHTSKIVVCNYERLHHFDPADFVCCILDESSILKNFQGQIKSKVTAFMKKIKYRFLSTATPSPNDYIELGTSSEALGYMGHMDMMTKFFKSNQNTADSRNRNIGAKFYLKPHAERDFFAWINQWSIMVKMPSDIGFSNDRYILPRLITNQHKVKNKQAFLSDGQMLMFGAPIARRLTDVRHEQKQTVQERCEKAVELASGKVSVYWCNRNDEGDLLESLDPSAMQIKGSMSIEQKEERLIAFADGEIDRLITKPKMTSFGLNWQHCNHTVFFPTFSYEQYYQAIRRFWRFGQKRDVTVDMVISDGQVRVIQALKEKTERAIQLYENLTKSVNSVYHNQVIEFDKPVNTPTWMK